MFIYIYIYIYINHNDVCMYNIKNRHIRIAYYVICVRHDAHLSCSILCMNYRSYI